MGFIKFFLAGLYLGLPFGPVGILCMGNTIEKGRKVGFVSAMGAVTVDMIYGLLALFLLIPAKTFIDNHNSSLKLGVGLFLVFIGLSKVFGKINIVGMQFSDNDNSSANGAQVKAISLKQEYFKIFLISLSNVFNFVGIFTIFAAQSISLSEPLLVLKLIAGILGAGAICWFITTTILNEVRKTITERTIKLLIRACGLGIALLGVGFFLQGLYLRANIG